MRPKIDLVSPLPPVRSGIADYTADLLPALISRADLRIVALPDQPVQSAVADLAPVVPLEALGSDGYVPLYQMGNNRHHEAVYDAARDVPGVLVLHDVVLHHLLIGRTAARDDLETYRRRLTEEHGWIGDAAARPLRWPGGHGDAAKFALPAHRSLLGRQRGVLTHSTWARDVLRESLPDLAVRTIPMGIPLPPAADAASGQAFRRAQDIPASAPLLGSFGFQTPIKRTDAVLRALADDALSDVYLVVGGEIAPASDLERLAVELGVDARVRFLGYVPFDAFEAAIAAVDLCLNLRYPTAGETSASLLRILALGRPAVVSDHAQTADLDDELVLKIPVGDGEAEALVTSLAALIADPSRLSRMGAHARAHVARRHRLEDAADAVVRAVADWRTASPLDPGPADPPRPTSLILGDLRGDLAVDFAQPWRAGTRTTLAITLTNRSEGLWLAGERGTGGIAIEIRLEAGGRDYCVGRPWLGLPVDLAPGERWTWTLDLRRPLGATTLHVEPHAFGRSELSRLGGPSFTTTLPAAASDAA